MSEEANILRAGLRSATTLAPLIKMAAAKAANGPDHLKRYQLGEAIRHARRLLTELELRRTELGWREDDAA